MTTYSKATTTFWKQDYCTIHTCCCYLLGEGNNRFYVVCVCVCVLSLVCYYTKKIYYDLIIGLLSRRSNSTVHNTIEPVCNWIQRELVLLKKLIKENFGEWCNQTKIIDLKRVFFKISKEMCFFCGTGTNALSITKIEISFAHHQQYCLLVP